MTRSGICLLLFAWAVFTLLQSKIQMHQVLLVLAVILVIFAISQAALDVALAAIFSEIMETLLSNGTEERLVALENIAVADCLFVVGGYIAIFGKLDISLPFALALATNFVLLGLTAIVKYSVGTLAQVVNIVPMMIMKTLEAAIRNYHQEVVEFLLQRGATRMNGTAKEEEDYGSDY
ncbi:hypothetical protein B0H10DRAFT_1963862 [Mycena sp. CBHHK59/15]|nr:hypothetical protein B0H10DRAFT_1963862 [Mycena sp. CBHHK59/15]